MRGGSTVAQDTCHGCDGKGWVMIITQERTVPFLGAVDRRPVAGHTVTTREYAAVSCPICKGSGDAPRKSDLIESQ
jgi:hypothetical protein